MKYNSFIILILILFIIVTLQVYLLFFVFYVSKAKDEIKSNTVKNLKNFYLLLINDVSHFLYNNNIERLDNYIKKISKSINKKITIVNSYGVAIIDSEENPKFIDNYSFEEINELIKKKEKIIINIYDIYQRKKLISYVSLINYENKVIGFLQISEYIENINKEMYKNIRYIILFSLIIFIFSLLSIIIIFYYVKKNILRLLDISNKVKDNNFNLNFNINDNYEFSELLKCFFSLIKNWSHLFNELSKEKEELKSVISSLKEGIMIIDKDGLIVMINESLKKILKNYKINNKYYWEIIRDNNFDNLFKEITKTKINFIKELFILERFFLISVTYIRSKSQYIFVFYDMTEIKNLDKIKKEFISNVSHELNTPLTSIKGYIETLLDEENDNTKRNFLEIISKHTERLINLVKDLLLLSKIDEKKSFDFKENVDLIGIIDNVLLMYREKIKKKGLFLNYTIKNEIPLIKGDPLKLEQVFINLIDNSYKYTEKGYLNLTLSKSPSDIIIEIEDSGIGIEEKELDKIFDRFYVVDKANNKGTGLGLSIVKEIVLLHNGKINVISKINKGTKFSVILPY